MASGIFAVANIGSVRLYVGECHHLKTRWNEMRAQLDQGTFTDPAVQQAWTAVQGDRHFSFHTAQDITDDRTIRGRRQFLQDSATGV